MRLRLLRIIVSAGLLGWLLLGTGCSDIAPVGFGECLLEDCPGGSQCQVKDSWCYIDNVCWTEG